MSRFLFERLQYASHVSRQTVPAFHLRLKLTASLSRQPVKFRLAVVLADAPVRFDQAFLFQPVQGGIKRTFLHTQHIVGKFLNSVSDAVSMLWRRNERFENQQVERTLQEIDL